MSRVLFCAMIAALPWLVADARADSGQGQVVTSRGSATTDPKSLTEAQRRRVAALADSGQKLYQDGNYASALDAFDEAEKLVDIPTIALVRGKCLERLGRWVEALSSYERAAAADLKSGAPIQLRQAKAEATTSLASLAPRIPTLSIRIDSDASGLRLLIDGRSVPSWNEPVLIDPGTHAIEVRSDDGESAVGSVETQEGTRQEVTLRPTRGEDAESPTVWKISSIAAMGLGGACVLGGVATAIGAASVRSELEERCPDGRCGPDDWGSVDVYDGLRYSSGTLLIAGTAIAAAGVGLYFFEPSQDVEISLSPIPTLGGGGALLRVRL